MGRHQIIYTSCQTGISGGNDGQQIYSYDKSFTDDKNDEVKSLFTYQTPALAPGVNMNEEVAKTMPRSFTYRKLSNGSCAFALNTYLGRDYMPGGRFGNRLSHVIMYDELEFSEYPCEFYGSEQFRSRMEFEEVNNKHIPDFLPVPGITKGSLINIETVAEFINSGDRLDILKNMLFAFLSYGTTKKRLVICDEQENIIMWIAAIEYCLPVRALRDINFTTYEFDPSLSSSQICGVADYGTRYTYDDPNHFIFDLKKNKTENFDTASPFFEFIDTSMSLSYDSLQAFHEFLSESYTYNRADERYYDAYYLYAIFSDGLKNSNKEMFKKATDFCAEFGSAREKNALLEQIIKETEFTYSIDSAYISAVIEAVLKSYRLLPVSSQKQARNFTVSLLILEFGEIKNEQDFNSLYEEAERFSAGEGIILSAEFMTIENQKKLFLALSKNAVYWKFVFIIKLLGDFITAKSISASDLVEGKPIGNLYSTIIQSVYKSNEKNGNDLAKKVLQSFRRDYKYLTASIFLLDGIFCGFGETLPNIGSPKDFIDSAWAFYYDILLESHAAKRTETNKTLLHYKRFDNIFDFYERSVSKSGSITEKEEILDEQLAIIFADKEYAESFQNKIFEAYYISIQKDNSANKEKFEKNLFEIILRTKSNVSFINALISNMTEKIPLESLSRENEDTVEKIIEYFLCNGYPSTGKLQLLYIGMMTENTKTSKSVSQTQQKCLEACKGKKADLTVLSADEADKYFKWLINCSRNNFNTPDKFIGLYDMFIFSSDYSNLFFTLYCRDYLKQTKNALNYDNLCMFFDFLFYSGKQPDRDAVGKELCALGKQKLEELNECACDYFKNNRGFLNYWTELHKKAVSTNPLFNKINSIFKKK